MMTAARFQTAYELHQRGNLAAAQALYEQIIEIQPRHFDALHLSGVIAAQLGDPRRAAELISRALDCEPDNAGAHFNRGTALQALGSFEAALRDYDRAVALQPDFAAAYSNRGLVLKALNRLELALDSCDRAVSIKPDFAQAHFNRGLVLHELRRLDAALASYDRAIAAKADYAEGYFNRGNVLRESNRLEAALASYERAIALRPNYVPAYANRGNVLQALGRLPAALADYDRVIALAPEDHVAYTNRGNVFREMNQSAPALADYDRAIALEPAFAAAHSNRGAVLRELSRWEEALESCNRAIALEFDFAEAHSNRGSVLHDLQQLPGALASHEQALALRPDFAQAHYNRSLTWLLSGDFERGCREHEWRWATRTGAKELRKFARPLWLGEEPLAGKTILLHAEQGLGDTIQFCRYAKQVADCGARVILEVQRPLLEVLKHLDGVTRLVARGDALPDFDLHCPLLSLPLALGTTLTSIPVRVPYLQADPAKVRFWGELLGAKLKPRVGLVWSGGSRPRQPELWSVNSRRNIPLAKLAPLALPDLEFHSLQKGQPAESELAHLNANRWQGPHLIDSTHLIKDFADTAALVEHLDLVISVDTSTAHLAGAMGKRVWLLNRFDTCWRWLLDRSDSPWYPTLRLYRQAHPGDWDGVIQQVRKDLSQLAQSGR